MKFECMDITLTYIGSAMFARFVRSISQRYSRTCTTSRSICKKHLTALLLKHLQSISKKHFTVLRHNLLCISPVTKRLHHKSTFISVRTGHFVTEAEDNIDTQPFVIFVLVPTCWPA